MNLMKRLATLWRLFTKGPMSKTDKLLLLAALAYCISPVDIVPDVVPLAGILDDILVVLAILSRLGGKGQTAQAADEEPPAVHVEAKVV